MEHVAHVRALFGGIKYKVTFSPFPKEKHIILYQSAIISIKLYDENALAVLPAKYSMSKNTLTRQIDSQI